jgi:hypothetical protein
MVIELRTIYHTAGRTGLLQSYRLEMWKLL